MQHISDQSLTDDPFAAFQIHGNDLNMLSLIQHSQEQPKSDALIKGCLHRYQQRLYKGQQAYIKDLQLVLDRDRESTPDLFKSHKIPISKDQNTVLPQCCDCGVHKAPHKYCPNCCDVHYCSEACEMRSKLTHQKNCRPRQQPLLYPALQMEVHLGSDLGRNIEVYFQHYTQMSLQMRGQKAIRVMFDHFNTVGRHLLGDGFTMEIKNNHLIYRRLHDPQSVSESGQPAVQTLKDLVRLYSANQFLGQIELYLLERGGILSKRVTEIHNNHLHVIFIFMCCL